MVIVGQRQEREEILQFLVMQASAYLRVPCCLASVGRLKILIECTFDIC